MMPDARRLSEARGWLSYAEEDLEVAELLISAPTPKVKPALFHAQQAVEKSLKAFLVLHNRTYPLTHSLNVLLDLCAEIDRTFTSTVGRALWLTQFAVRFRYPGEEEEPTLGKAQEGVSEARAVHSSICERLLQAG